MRKLLAEMPPAEAVVQAWPLVCGTATAAHAEALDFAEGVLRVRVENREWLTNLRELAGKLLQALRVHCGDAVKRIEFVLADQPDGAPGAETQDLKWLRSRR